MRNYLILPIALGLSGCAALGYIDSKEFVSLINTTPRKCEEARYMVASKLHHSSSERLTYLGLVEVYCGDKREGIGMLHEAASMGDVWAATELARQGVRLPRHVAPAAGAVPPQQIDIRIIK